MMLTATQKEIQMTTATTLKTIIECFQDDYALLEDCIRLAQMKHSASDAAYYAAFDEIKNTVDFRNCYDGIECKSKVQSLFKSEVFEL